MKKRKRISYAAGILLLLFFQTACRSYVYRQQLPRKYDPHLGTSQPAVPFEGSPLADSIGARFLQIVLKRTTFSDMLSLPKWERKSRSEYLGIFIRGQIAHEYNKHDDPDRLFPGFSLTKTIVATLIAIAEEAGLLCIDDPMTMYLSEYMGRTSRCFFFDNITIRHLLLHSSGIMGNPKGNHLSEWMRPQLDMKAIRLRTAPCVTYNYSATNYQLLVAILETVTGMGVADYFQQEIGIPLGWSAKSQWRTKGKAQHPLGFTGIAATPADWARFARLFCTEGRHGGLQVLPKQFVAAAISLIPNDCGHPEIRVSHVFNDPGTQFFYAKGLLGQQIYICPALDVVILRFAKASPVPTFDLTYQMSGLMHQITDQL